VLVVDEVVDGFSDTLEGSTRSTGRDSVFQCNVGDLNEFVTSVVLDKLSRYQNCFSNPNQPTTSPTRKVWDVSP